MYKMYLGTMLCPVTPSKIDVKIKGQNKTLTLINDVQVNVLKSSGLTEISFDLLLPNVKYSFADYNIVWKNAKWYLNRLEDLKTKKKVFQYILTRTLPNGKPFYDTNISVTLENYTIKEDAKQGFDVVVSVTLKQYREYGTKIVKVSNVDGTASVEKTRETANSPAPSENSIKTHTVTGNDTLWNIAKMYYGDGSKYTVIYEANKDKISNPSVIREGQVLTIPGATSSAITTNENPNNTSVKQTAPQTDKKMVTVLYMGVPTHYGDFQIQYFADGKAYYKDFPNQISVKVDKGTEVTVIPKAVEGGNFYFQDETDGVWEVASTKTPGRKAVVNDNVRISIVWCSVNLVEKNKAELKPSYKR